MNRHNWPVWIVVYLTLIVVFDTALITAGVVHSIPSLLFGNVIGAALVAVIRGLCL